MGYFGWDHTSNVVSIKNNTGNGSISINVDGSIALTCSTSLFQTTGDYLHNVYNNGSTWMGSFGVRGSADSSIGLFTNFTNYKNGSLYVNLTVTSITPMALARRSKLAAAHGRPHPTHASKTSLGITPRA